MNRKMTRLAAGFLVPALCISMLSAPALAQPPRRPGGYPGGRYYPPPPPYRRASDLDRTLAVIGTVGAVAAIVGSRNGYYRPPYYPPYYRQPAVVVAPSHPVVVEKQVVVEQPVIVERQVPVVVGSEGAYSPTLKASFHIENMQIPGHRFTAARLVSDPLPDSPLNSIGLRRGDVITRLDNSPADTLAELERHDKNTRIRYIKTGTTKVLLANVYIPAGGDSETYYAP